MSFFSLSLTDEDDEDEDENDDDDDEDDEDADCEASGFVSMIARSLDVNNAKFFTSLSSLSGRNCTSIEDNGIGEW